jgi:pilus assembly protein CpaB
MSRRTVALIASIVLAAVAAVALISYVRHVENSTNKGLTPVSVLVAKDTIPAGTTAEDASSKGLFQNEDIPTKYVPSGAIGDVSQIKGEVAQVTVSKGEILVATRWGAPGTVGTGLPIPSGKVAMTIQVDLIPGVAGFVQPGNLVSVIAQQTVRRAGAGPNGATETRTQYVVQALTVLAIGPRLVAAPGQPAPAQAAGGPVVATLALTPVEAEKLAYAVFNGRLYLTLLPQGAKPVTSPGRTLDNAFS